MSISNFKMKARKFISTTSSLIEIYISIIILIGVFLLSIDVVKQMISMFYTIWSPESTVQYYQTFFDYALQLIISIEFVKMLSKHTPESAVEVLVFVIAKRVITTLNFTSLDVILCVVALAFLFGIKKYLCCEKNSL